MNEKQLKVHLHLLHGRLNFVNDIIEREEAIIKVINDRMREDWVLSHWVSEKRLNMQHWIDMREDLIESTREAVQQLRSPKK